MAREDRVAPRVDDRSARLDVVAGIDALGPSHGRLFVVVGVFDGLHLGHAYLLRHLRSEARARGARPAVVTFDHHPDEVLTGAAPPLLCDPDDRLALLSAGGAEVIVVQHFDLALRMTSYEAFIRRIAERVDLAGLLMTPDSAFGHERRGTPEAVAALGRTVGYEVVVIPPLDLDGRPVRSAEIRADIAAGNLAGAHALLGRPYAVVGDRTHAGPLHDPRPASSDPAARVAAAQRPADAGVSLAFPMPVALPPAGEYPVRVTATSAADPGFGQVGWATARLDGSGSLLLVGPSMPAGHRLRVTFA
jgi:hypothetical protein